jgi:hypothetical protein
MTTTPAARPAPIPNAVGGENYQGTARYDTPEMRVLRDRAAAQARNLLNAIKNGAYPHALTLRAGEAAESVRHLAETQIDHYKETRY